jgi:hypothetical protein
MQILASTIEEQGYPTHLFFVICTADRHHRIENSLDPKLDGLVQDQVMRYLEYKASNNQKLSQEMVGRSAGKAIEVEFQLKSTTEEFEARMRLIRRRVWGSHPSVFT